MITFSNMVSYNTFNSNDDDDGGGDGDNENKQWQR